VGKAQRQGSASGAQGAKGGRSVLWTQVMAFLRRGRVPTEGAAKMAVS
jgi:hypothetical protein